MKRKSSDESTKAFISETIKKQMKLGKSQKQAVAIALSEAREAGARIPKKRKKAA